MGNPRESLPNEMSVVSICEELPVAPGVADDGIAAPPKVVLNSGVPLADGGVFLDGPIPDEG